MTIKQSTVRTAHPADLPRLSVVMPCYDEQGLLEHTHARVRQCLEQLHVSFEIIYVDDGSRDGTFRILQEIQERDPAVRVVRLSRNFGHQVAITAGMDESSGAAVVVLDADLRDPPELIAEMLARWEDGAQVVSGVRRRRAGESGLRLLATRAFYRLLSWMSDVPLCVESADFRLLDRNVVDLLKGMPEPDRYLRGMIPWIGFQQVAIPYDRAPRASGAGKYTLAKLVKLALDGLTSCANPMRLCFGMSGCLLITGLSLFVVAFYSRHGAPLGTIAVVCGLFGIQTFWLGVLGEFAVRSFRASLRRPLYIVQGRLGGGTLRQSHTTNRMSEREGEKLIHV